MPTPSGAAWIVDCTIGKVNVSSTNVTMHVTSFEWKSMVNGGFIVRAKVQDPYFQILGKIIENDSNSLLKKGRQFNKEGGGLTDPLLISFKLRWDNGEQSATRVALISDMHAIGGSSFGGSFEFIAIDPISYYINSGDCAGTMYHGRIGGDGSDGQKPGVIAQVLKDYIPDNIGDYKFEFKVSSTTDKPNNYWMMRQDPKTFILSLLDWSSSLTKHKTSWIVASGQEEQKKLSIHIKESWTPDLKYPDTKGDGPAVFSYGGGPGVPVVDILKWELLTDNFISALNVKLLTSGVSAISGKYSDKISDKDDEKIVYVKDSNTSDKSNPGFTKEEGFTKPIEGSADKRGWTHIMSVPEMYSAGEIGVEYEKYVDGRPRQKFMEMLNMLMRIRVTVRGQSWLYDSTELGRTKVTLRWLKPDEEDGSPKKRFLDGDWLMYGWHHRLRQRGWVTDVYLARLDWDAASAGGN